MAQLIITIPDAQVPRLLAAYAKKLNVETATAAMVRQDIINHVKDVVRTYEYEEAKRAVQPPPHIDAT